jgi:hypothetical protein
LCPGRTDIHADAGQSHVVGNPDRIVLEGAIHHVVVVVGIRAVLVRQGVAIEMVGEGVPLALILIIRHDGILGNPPPACEWPGKTDLEGEPNRNAPG